YGYAQNTNASTGGYYQSVFNAAQAAGLVSSYEKSGGYSEEILNRLNAGYGLTLSIGDTTGGTRHAITLWGVEYDDVTSQLTKMYVTDSDDIRGSLNFNPGGIFEMTWLHQGWRQ
uniref:IdeS/Mac family cysteine endopeptidase n=1 Tax=uncultured Akkermansia sp. TaxID=512294 RepID=UPI00265D5341